MRTIILAGGAGRRLWPVSTDENPKQFIKFEKASGSLLQETFTRALTVSRPEEIFIVTNSKYKVKVLQEILSMGFCYSDENIIGEPAAKNTLPAICAGLLKSRYVTNDEIVVFPADHHIQRMDVLADSIRKSSHLAQNGIVTFGIKPSYAETGYGYIEPGQPEGAGYCVKSFHEKPGAEAAADYLKKGFLWNSGIFMFTAGVFEKEMMQYQPGLLSAFNRKKNLDDIYMEIAEGISIDKGLLEKTHSVFVVPVNIGWSDLGNFDALHNVTGKDGNGNSVSGDCLLLDSKENVVFVQNPKKLILAGIEDSLVIEGEDVLLICKKDKIEKVRKLVEEQFGRDKQN